LGLPRPTIKFLGKSELPFGEKKAIIFLGMTGTTTAFMYWLISSADKWFLAKFAGASVVGAYSIASSIGSIGLLLNSSLTLTWFPEASRLYGRLASDALPEIGRLWERLIVGLALVWLAVAAGGGDVLRLLTAPAFHSSAAYVPWIAGGVFLYSVAGLANTAYFISGKMRAVGIFWALGGLICLGIYGLIIPPLGATGAAIGQSLTYALIATCVLSRSRYILAFPINWRRLGVSLLFILAVGGVMIPPWAETPALSIAMKLPLGIATALVVVWFVARNWLDLLSNRISSIPNKK
jgi:O-antigen/teichoic acid export membrane protein